MSLCSCINTRENWNVGTELCLKGKEFITSYHPRRLEADMSFSLFSFVKLMWLETTLDPPPDS